MDNKDKFEFENVESKTGMKNLILTRRTVNSL